MTQKDGEKKGNNPKSALCPFCVWISNEVHMSPELEGYRDSGKNPVAPVSTGE
jgi:hypothetical protein